MERPAQDACTPWTWTSLGLRMAGLLPGIEPLPGVIGIGVVRAAPDAADRAGGPVRQRGGVGDLGEALPVGGPEHPQAVAAGHFLHGLQGVPGAGQYGAVAAADGEDRWCWAPLDAGHCPFSPFLGVSSPA